MKKILLVFIGIIVLCISCNQNKSYELIPKDDMIPLLVDMHVLDGILSISSERAKLIEADTSNLYDRLLYTYGYSRTDFDSSVFYYTYKMDEFDNIYQEVLNRLNQMDTQVQEAKDTLPKEESDERD